VSLSSFFTTTRGYGVSFYEHVLCMISTFRCTCNYRNRAGVPFPAVFVLRALVSGGFEKPVTT
jgi:hypothetical protein